MKTEPPETKKSIWKKFSGPWCEEQRYMACVIALGFIFVLFLICLYLSGCIFNWPIPFSKKVCKMVNENPPWILLSGLAAAPSLILIWYWRDKHKRADIKKGLEDIEIAREGQITERFTRAVEMLGSEKMEIRLGAIYALERISRDSVKDHWTVIETLAAYIRKNSRKIYLSSSDNDKIKTDVQAALTVIGRRRHKKTETELVDLSGIDISKTRSSRLDIPGTNLQEANFSGATLSRANLEGADLDFADFTKATLIGVNLHKAIVDHTDFKEAIYSKTKFPDGFDPKKREMRYFGAGEPENEDENDDE